MIAIIIGSKSDLEVVKEGSEVLKEFNVEYEIKILSAHRTPAELKDYLNTLSEKKCEVIIAVAGMAAHLPGVIASYTTLPVIGVPLASSPLAGLDSLLSIVQMPAGIPVATMAIGKSGVNNACLFAIAILALKYPELKEKLNNYREKLKRKVLEEK